MYANRAKNSTARTNNYHVLLGNVSKLTLHVEQVSFQHILLVFSDWIAKTGPKCGVSSSDEMHDDGGILRNSSTSENDQKETFG